MSETIPVTFTVTSVQRLHGASHLLALATVEIDLDGMPLTLSGIQVVRRPNGKLECRAPHYRAPTGKWSPAITLPDDLEIAIGAEVLAGFV